ncbi:MAG: ATP-binding cassette domain-containing protein [Nitrospirae bacterium]|nr:ATP-binding cassette domain-containing protein [Nitrospirota bacterium]
MKPGGNDALLFDNVTAPGGGAWNLALSPGKVARVIIAESQNRNLFIRLLMGLETPANGCVTVLGRDTTDALGMENISPRIGVVSHSGGLISNLSVYENVSLPLYYNSSVPEDEIDRRVTLALEAVGYDGPTTALPGTLPTFTRRLLGLARAMAQKPDIVVADSLLAGLPPDAAERIAGVFRTMRESNSGVAVVWVVSSPDEKSCIAFDLEAALS